MLHEKPVKYGPLGDEVDEANMAWTGEKRRRKYLPQSSSSDAPTTTAQDPIPHAFLGAGEAAKGHHQGLISDMAIVQEQDHALRPRTDSGEEETQELGLDLSAEDQAIDTERLPPDVLPLDSSMTPSMSWPERLKVLAQHARYRIAYYKTVKPDSELNGSEYSEDELRKKGYFEFLEDDGGFEWFFHPDATWNPDLDDYQRIDLRNVLPGSNKPEYLNVCEYHGLYHTYEMDALYVKYYGEISKTIKWIESFLHLDQRSEAWNVMETKGWRQALRIATNFPNMTIRLASFAYDEYIAELRDDAALKGLDLVYFEIWRLVVKENKEYKEAVELVHAMDRFRMHKCAIEAELTGAPVFQTMRQKIYGIILEGGIFANTEENKAQDLFRKGVARLKIKNMVKYAQKKMEIAERLNLHKRQILRLRFQDRLRLQDVPGQIEAPGQIEVS